MKFKGVSLIIFKILYSIGCFILFLFLFSFLLNQGNTDMTGTMDEASYPVMYFTIDGYNLNMLHGNANVMDTAYLKEGLVPIKNDRKISFTIDTYGTQVDKIRYEIRSLDGERLIENTDVYNYLTNGNIVTADVTIKDLIDKNKQYSLCIILQTGSGKEIRYYTNIEEADDYNTGEKLAFAYYFTKTCFDKVETKEDLKKYMETNEKGDNSSFHHVNIHSNLEQLSWGNTGAKPASDLMATLLEVNKNSAVVRVDYYVSTGEEEETDYYIVQDTYRMTKGQERMFLYDFERDVEQIFSLDNAVMNNNKIMLGITDAQVEMIESQDGNQIAFANNGRLYSYNISDNKLAYIFGFYSDKQQNDIRASFNHHDIKIFSIDENGNVYFIVYGYMNKGNHEGQSGVSVFYYDSVINNVEEKVFIPYYKSYDLLKDNIEKFAYVNQSGDAYIFMNDSLYKIKLDEARAEIIVNNVPFGGFVVSDDRTMAAWISGGDINNASQVVLLNMVTGRQSYVQAGDDNRIRAFGFFSDDLIYGLARKTEIKETENGKTIFPIFKMAIRAENGNVLKEYEQPGVYIMNTLIDDTMLTLERAEKNGDDYVYISNDEILNNKGKTNKRNTVEKVITENFETIIQLALKSDINTKTMQILTPKFVLYEGERNIELVNDTEDNTYYVYIKGKYNDVYRYTNDAIDIASNNFGVVVNGKGQYIYSAFVQDKKNQIMTITEHSIKEGEEAYVSRAVCLNTMLEHAGTSTDTRAAVRNNPSPMMIFKEKLPSADVIDLTGCNADTYKYYLEKNIPVMITYNDDTAVLLIGYNEIAYVYMDPVTGTIYKKGKDDTEKHISENGKQVFTYIN